MLKNPILQGILTVFGVILFCKYVAPKIPVFGKYISL